MIPMKQPAIDLSRGLNFLPQKNRYNLPDKKNNVSVFLISNSFEYDIELIKHMSTGTSINYKNIAIPRVASVSFGSSIMKYNLNENEARRRGEYIRGKKIIPPVTPIISGFNKADSTNVYIPFSDIMKSATAALRNMTEEAVSENIINIFNNVLSVFASNMKDKVVVIDTTKFKLCKSASKGNYKSDIVNALLSSCVLNPSPKIRKFNTILICDEIQCGYGRSGKFFAHQWLDVKPDMITVAKGICNGFPMAGVLISPKFKPVYGQLGTTFGGNHLGCAGAIAVLDIMEKENLVENANKVGTYLIETLTAEMKAGNLPHVVDVRGEGLMIGIELDIPYKEPRTRLIKEQHCFTGCAGTNVIRLLPPLCLTKAEADDFIARFKAVL